MPDGKDVSVDLTILDEFLFSGRLQPRSAPGCSSRCASAEIR
jgi:hypothetical protein